MIYSFNFISYLSNGQDRKYFERGFRAKFSDKLVNDFPTSAPPPPQKTQQQQKTNKQKRHQNMSRQENNELYIFKYADRRSYFSPKPMRKKEKCYQHLYICHLPSENSTFGRTSLPPSGDAPGLGIQSCIKLITDKLLQITVGSTTKAILY